MGERQIRLPGHSEKPVLSLAHSAAQPHDILFALVGVVNSVGGAPFFVALNGASTTYCSGQTRVQVSNGVSSVFVVVVVWCCGCEVLVLWYSGMV